MSEENKCVGLDCAICAETKCPNEKTIINGIDVSESVSSATNNNIYYSQKAVDELLNDIKHLQEENEGLKKHKKRCAFKSLDNTFCDKAKIKIDKLELDKDCLNASLETARKYRGIAEADRDKYKQALENIKLYINQECENKQCPQTCANCFMGNVLIKVNEVLNDNRN